MLYIMTFNLNVAVLILAVISQDVKCKNSLEIQFIEEFIEADLTKSLKIIAFLCWDKYDSYSLLKHLSSKNKIASIYRMDEEKVHHYFPPPNILFLTDLDCDNSTNILQKANNEKLFAAPFKWLLLTQNNNYINSSKELFGTYNIYPDSNVVVSYKKSRNEMLLYEVFKYGKFDTEVVVKNITKWKLGEGFERSFVRILSHERRDINGTVLPAAVVVLVNDSIHHLTDLRNKEVDTLAKVNYVFVNHLIDYVNGTKNFSFVNTWGYFDKSINMYSGMIGTLQRDETEIGGTCLFVTSDRVPVIEYASMTTPTRAAFIFRQPPLSYVANVFTLPFSRDVWISSLALCIIASFLLYLAVSWEWNQRDLEVKENALQRSFMDTVMLTIGAVAQQGSTSEPRSGAGKIIMIFTFIALMFLYVSYSANIVALLQSSATNIRTLDDLLHSRLKLGVQDTVYNRYYFEKATEKTRKAIYEEKVAPKGQKASFMGLLEGAKGVQKGFFAFHAEKGTFYKHMADIFLENEKCGIQEIPYLQFVEPYLAIKKNSSYKEILISGLRKIYESGIQSREIQRFYTKKPVCVSSGGNFVSVGLLDAYAAFLVLAFGMLLSFALFLGEKIYYKRMMFRNLIIK